MVSRIKHLYSQSRKNFIFLIISLVFAVTAGAVMTVMYGLWYGTLAGLAGIVLPWFFRSFMVDHTEGTSRVLKYSRYMILILIAVIQALVEREYSHLNPVIIFSYAFYCLYVGAFFWFFSDEQIIMLGE